MDEVKILENLYYGDDEEAKAAINQKRIWIDSCYFVPGNILHKKDESNLLHYPFIESLYDNVLLFENISFSDPNFTANECLQVQETSKNLATLTVYVEIDRSINTDFWIKYDFRKMELSMYHDLVANFYHKLSYEELRINKNKIVDASADLIKSLIIGKPNECILIISKDYLLNMCYYCPILSKIYYRKRIANDLLDSLKEIALKNSVDIEEINEN